MPETPTSLLIATRESRLALWQAEHVRDLLQARLGCTVDLLGMTTRGDQILDRTLSKVGGKGLFVKELETALEEGRAHLAVHSLKDVPMELPDGFELACVLDREDPRDALVSNTFATLADLPQGARPDLSVDGVIELEKLDNVLKMQRPSFGQDNGTDYLVMELVEGEDLSAVIARGPMSLADALPVARQIAEQHGGHISVESVEGQGSTFSVSFPLLVEDPATASAPAATSTAKSGTDRRAGMRPMKARKVALLTGEGVNGNAAGEVWHFMEQIRS